MRKGFTLIELLISIAIMVVLFSMALLVDTSFYRRTSIDSERDTVLSFLSRARSLSIANVHEAKHGLYIGSSTYVLFEGDSYASRNTALDETYPRSGGFTFSGTSEVVFKELEGTPLATATISLTNESRSVDVTVNQEGMIEW